MAEKYPVTETKVEDDEEDLDALLNSALEDFKKPPVLPGAGNSTKDQVSDDSEGLKWTEEFLQQASANLDKNLKSLLGGVSKEDPSPEQIEAEVQKMAEAAAQAFSEAGVNPSEFSEIMSQTLKNLAEGMDGFQNNLSEEELSKMFNEINVGEEGDDEESELLKSMQHVIQFLLSKDILYPVLCEFVEKYPTWIEDNKQKLSSSDVERYTKQKDLMAKICEEFKNDSEADSPTTKNERFSRIFSLMQKMQELGEPPRELLNEIELPDSSGQADFLAQGKSLCSIM